MPSHMAKTMYETTVMTAAIVTMRLRVDIVDTPVAGDFPALDGVVVIERPKRAGQPPDID